MVLKEKEDLCNWFKLLHPRKRIDYMCGLLHLCHPLELRFIGTVLEDIAKKDFNHLRDAENKANNPSELSNDGSQSFADPQFRAKVHVNLALMHSADGSCADILFGILEKQFSNLSYYLQDEQVLEEILTILTLACHHPAFKIKQRLRIGEILKNTEDHCHHQWDNPAFPKNFQSWPSMTINRVLKVITSMFVNGIRDEVQNKKSGPDYEIHTTWSNGEVTQHFMKHKELQNLHHQIFNKFPEEKRLQHLFPNVQGPRRYRHESKEEKISTINSYFSELSKAQHILVCDILTRAFQNGKPIAVPTQMSPPYSHNIYYPQYIPENRFCATFPDSYRVPYYPQPPPFNLIAATAPVLSSATTSPSNSRSSSPSVTINNNNNNKTTRTGLDASIVTMEKSGGHTKPKAGLHQQQQQEAVDAAMPTESPLQVETIQLLKILDLEKYSKILAGYTLHEVNSMTPEEMAKLGLPPDAQSKLQSRLDPQKHSFQDMNGVIQLQAPGSITKQERMMHSFPPIWQGIPMLQSDTATSHPTLPPAYHPIRRFIVAHQNAIPSSLPSGADNSPCASDQCTPSLSPGVNSLPDSPPSSLASPNSVYLEDKNTKNHHQVDSSGSEEDKIRGQNVEGSESAPYRVRGPNRPQQSASLPHISSIASSSAISEKGKVMGVPASISAPVMANEAPGVREAGTPPMVPVINGFGSENSFVPHHSIVMLQQQHQHHRYKSAQPTHMGPRMHKNVVNMPPDLSTQPPPPAPSIGKNPIMLHHPYYIHSPQPQANNIGSPQQLPSGQALLPPALSSGDNVGSMAALSFMHTIVPGSNFMPLQSHNVMTSMSNSSTPLTHPPGHQHQQPAAAAASHSPSPVNPSTSVQQEQTQVAGYIHSNAEGDGLVDGRQEDSHSSTPTPTSNKPPIHNNTANNNGTLSHIPNMTGPGSGTATPSPPLHQPPPPPPKQIVVTSEMSSHPQQHQSMFGSHRPMYMINSNVSVTMPPYSTNPHQQNSLQQHFPNGITPEVYLPPNPNRFPLPPMAAYYGSQAFNPNAHIHHHNNNNGNGLSHHAVGSGGGGGNNGHSNNNKSGGGKNSCYNCGSSGHKANECKENHMDSMTKSYRLNIKPKSDSE